jgi:hypothetical protein
VKTFVKFTDVYKVFKDGPRMAETIFGSLCIAIDTDDIVRIDQPYGDESCDLKIYFSNDNILWVDDWIMSRFLAWIANPTAEQLSVCIWTNEYNKNWVSVKESFIYDKGQY